MRRTDINVIPHYFQKYVDTIPGDLELVEALENYGIPFVQNELPKYRALGDRVYAPGKWTMPQVLIHLIDTERIFAYRALRFARVDEQPLAGMDQDHYVTNANVAGRSIDDLFEEFKSVRNASISLFRSFDDQHWNRTGVASGMEVSVGALGFMICGHLCHHHEVNKRSYYPLLEP